MIKCNIVLLIALVLITISGTSAAAFNVDGVNSTDEWDQNWNFGQINGTGYDPSGPFGDKMVVYQDGNWYDNDPAADAGSNYNENLSVEGSYPSGYDIKGIYAHYDILNDTLYGMATVYGLPGDLDGDGNIVGLAENGDILGNVTGKPITGIGPGEQWSIVLLQNERMIMITITNNDWNANTIGISGFDINDVHAANSNAGGPDNCTNCVYEISISNLSDYFDMLPGEQFSVASSAGGNLDIVGEDIAAVFFEIPNPSIDIEKSTNGEDADSAPGPGIPKGNEVLWTYIVNNTGNVPLVNVTVIDDQLGPVTNIIYKGDGDDVLAIGENWIYVANGTAECGQYENNATAVGFFDVIGVFDTDPSHYFGECPDIDIEKATNGEDADTAPGPGVMEGDAVTWTYVVTNTGNVNLTNIQVSDDILGSITTIIDQGDGDAILSVGEVWTLEATGNASCGQYENEGSVTGDYGSTTVNDSDLSHYFGECPDIDIEKATNGEDADTAPGPSLDVGDAVTWTYVVTNTGNVNLSNIQVSDNILGSITTIIDQGDGDDVLSVGEVWTLEATGSASCGDYANIGTVTGDYNEITVSDEDPSHYNVVCAPNIDIEKSTNGVDADTAPGPVLVYGSNVTWEYVVRNTGNVYLTNVTVNDNQLGTITNIVDKGNGDDTLLPGEVWTYQATGSAECGQYANIGDVIGYYGSIPVTDSDPSHYNVICEPDIDIEKYINGEDADQPPGVLLSVGDEIIWTFVVENTGNIPLENIVVDDDKLGIIPDSAIISKSINNDDILDPGEVWTYELNDSVKECVPQYKNTATVTGEAEGEEVTDKDVAHYYCQPVVPLLSPVGMLIFVASLGLVGIFYLRRRE
jgi:conserved repeat domain